MPALVPNGAPGQEPVQVSYSRLPDPAPGVREYAVRAGDRQLGTVTNRRGGWWRAFTAAGDMRGSFHTTRNGAATALLTD